MERAAGELGRTVAHSNPPVSVSSVTAGTRRAIKQEEKRSLSGSAEGHRQGVNKPRKKLRGLDRWPGWGAGGTHNTGGGEAGLLIVWSLPRKPGVGAQVEGAGGKGRRSPAPRVVVGLRITGTGR